MRQRTLQNAEAEKQNRALQLAFSVFPTFRTQVPGSPLAFSIPLAPQALGPQISGLSSIHLPLISSGTFHPAGRLPPPLHWVSLLLERLPSEPATRLDSEPGSRLYHGLLSRSLHLFEPQSPYLC